MLIPKCGIKSCTLVTETVLLILCKSINTTAMDLTETMKNIVAKGIQTEMGPPFPGTGYVTEKLYMLLQLYLQNKGWNPSVELLQCFTELKEASMLPSAAYLQ